MTNMTNVHLAGLDLVRLSFEFIDNGKAKTIAVLFDPVTKTTADLKRYVNDLFDDADYLTDPECAKRQVEQQIDSLAVFSN